MMTTNINAMAGPSRLSISPKIEDPSLSPEASAKQGGNDVSKAGVSLDENGEVVKVPAFLNKLFSMVSDSGTQELIYWSDTGESFFVPNQERFGKELLPRFFKHSNFSSFVRQLNMYGFHKVPHLQSGVLKNDNPIELWEFINPFFKRGEPQLLSRVTRKNNRPGMMTQAIPQGAIGTRSSIRQAGTSQTSGMMSPGGEHYHPVHLITDGTTEGEALPLVGSTGQMIDLSSITSGIAAIRQTQANIGADLKALQTSNEHLWREALESRERHDKHQETIDLIVTFLERLFGTEGEGLKGLKEALRRGALGRGREDEAPNDGGTPKKRRRLGLDRMIASGPNSSSQDSDGHIVELTNGPPPPSSFSLPLQPRPRSGKIPPTIPPSASTDPWSSTSQRFTNLPTEDDGSPSNSSTRPNSSKGDATPVNGILGQGVFSPVYADGNHDLSNGNALAPYTHFSDAQVPPLSPTSAAKTAAALNLDPALLQTTIGSLLQSPAAAQMFLNSLTQSTQAQALQAPSHQLRYPSQPVHPSAQTQGQHPQANGMEGGEPTLALFSPLPNQAALLQNSDSLLRSYQAADGMGTDVDKLQQDMDALVRSLGLDLPANGVAEPNGEPELNVDDFLNHLGSGGGDEGGADG